MDNPTVHLARSRFRCAVNIPVPYIRGPWCQSLRYTKHTLGHFQLRGKGTNVVRK